MHKLSSHNSHLYFQLQSVTVVVALTSQITTQSSDQPGLACSALPGLPSFTIISQSAVFSWAGMEVRSGLTFALLGCTLYIYCTLYKCTTLNTKYRQHRDIRKERMTDIDRFRPYPCHASAIPGPGLHNIGKFKDSYLQSFHLTLIINKSSNSLYYAFERGN